ncbi:MAG: type II toxin-antitoxin system PemK/MazF family toxin [Coriobacteriales bacterium]|nr:type II toxin-antitoxin system PemK/MazF family toxin [Coriobacteriales bacterium]
MIFSQGDVVMLSFDPSLGHEPAGRRPAVIVSNNTYNDRTSLTLVCPVTSVDSGFPLHVPLPESAGAEGFVMTEQLQAFDLHARNVDLAHIVGALDEPTLGTVTTYLKHFF